MAASHPRGQKKKRAHRRSRTLGRYLDGAGRRREVVARPGSAESVLVVDRDAETLEDRRLVAHLGADEPRENAEIVCGHYLEAVRLSANRCRVVSNGDLRRDPRVEDELSSDWFTVQQACCELLDSHGRLHRLEFVRAGMSIPALRWRRLEEDAHGHSVSVREVVAALERYEPVQTLTRSALASHHEDPEVSVTTLRSEFGRVLYSPIVLNRALREAVLARVTRQELSMSEIAIRCGRVKRDSRGHASGETSWLARRLGLLPEGGNDAPTPWIHSDVLALIARDGLGLSPREVEL
jgi:hypothetical protein